jgi:hypothetical protein
LTYTDKWKKESLLDSCTDEKKIKYMNFKKYIKKTHTQKTWKFGEWCMYVLSVHNYSQIK